MPAVSVIVPVYNAAAFLNQCLECLTEQTLSDLEILCIDDGSTDGSLSLLRSWSEKDKRLKIISFQENRGPSSARNAGLDSALGEFVGFVDSDDFVDPDFFEKLYSAAIREKADVAKGTLLNFDPKKGNSYQKEIFNLNDRIRSHKAWFFLTYTSAIYRRNMLREGGIRFNEQLRFFEDPHFSIHAAFHYDKIVLVDDAVYYYTDNPRSATRMTFSMDPLLDLISGTRSILTKMEDLKIDDTHYRIVFAFLMDQYIGWCQKYYATDPITAKAAEGLSDLLLRCRDLPGCMNEYVFFKKDADKRNLIRQLKRDLHG